MFKTYRPREKKCSFHLQISFNEAEHNKHVKNRKEKNSFIKSPAKRQPHPPLQSLPPGELFTRKVQGNKHEDLGYRIP